jgi:hypothetical protein
MNEILVEQGSAAWFAARRGLVTASRVSDAIARPKRKDGELLCRRDYRLQIVSEILTGISQDHYVSPAMEYGTENEPLARTAYEMALQVDVKLVGFALHPTISRAGCSPDGIIGENGLVQFKVPNTSTHIQYIIDGVVPKDYVEQMQWEMACCGPEFLYNDFVSHDPRIKEEDLQTLIIRLPRDNAKIAEMESEILLFLAEVDEMMLRLKEHAAGESTIERQLRESLHLVGKPQPIVTAMETE